MIREVPEKAMKDVAVHCAWHLQCLTEPQWKPCAEGQRLITDKLLQTSEQTPQKTYCHFHTYFGEKHYCTCPVRIEIYKRYKV